MQSTYYKQAVETMNSVKLTAYDFHCDECVYLVHEESSHFFWRSAFLRLFRDWVFVYTEHHGYHCYHKSDLVHYRHFKEQPRKSLEWTGLTDKCETCNKEFKVEELSYTYQDGNDFLVECEVCRGNIES